MYNHLVTKRLNKLALKARQDLGNGTVDKKLLAELYREYNPEIEDVDNYVAVGLSMFPRLCCGLASTYLKHTIGHGEITTGQYSGQLHTFLLVDSKLVDITSDQFGGPPVYVGYMKKPWKF